MFKSKKIYTFIHYFNKLTILYPSNLFMIINYFKQITILCPPNLFMTESTKNKPGRKNLRGNLILTRLKYRQ